MSKRIYRYKPKSTCRACIDLSTAFESTSRINIRNLIFHANLRPHFTAQSSAIINVWTLQYYAWSLLTISPCHLECISPFSGSYLRRWGSLQGSAFVGVCYTENYQWTLVLPSKVWIMHPRVSPFSHEPTTYSKDGSPWRPWHCANEVI